MFLLRWSLSSLSQGEGWHAPAGRRTCETLASDPGQADQTGSAGRCQKNWARPTDRFARQPERRQPNRRSGRDPGSRPYARIQSKPGKPGRKHYPQSPCRIGAREPSGTSGTRDAHISQLCVAMGKRARSGTILAGIQGPAQSPLNLSAQGGQLRTAGCRSGRSRWRGEGRSCRWRRRRGCRRGNCGRFAVPRPVGQVLT